MQPNQPRCLKILMNEDFMKKRFFMLNMILLFSGILSAQPYDIQAGIFNSGTTLEIKANPATSINNLVFSAVNFAIRWDDSYNVSLGEITSSFGISKNGTESNYLSGSTYYRYQVFSGIPNTNINWTAGQPVLLISIPVNQTGFGGGIFELAPSDFLPSSGEEWYIEIGGLNRTNPEFNPGFTEEVPLPVELSAFSAKVLGNQINLKWETKTETNNYGFEIERKNSDGTPLENWDKIGFLPGYGNSNTPKNYSFIDKNPVGGSKFIYRLKQMDVNGKFNYSDEVEIELLPDKFTLYQNYPNPFNPTTNINVAVPIAGKVNLTVFNILGEKVKEIFSGFLEMGIHSFQFNGEDLAAGIYMYRLHADNFTQVKKMQLIK